MRKDRKILSYNPWHNAKERNLSKITTAALAEKSGITEAALYSIFQAKDYLC